jgi:hypothetical protein
MFQATNAGVRSERSMLLLGCQAIAARTHELDSSWRIVYVGCLYGLGHAAWRCSKGVSHSPQQKIVVALRSCFSTCLVHPLQGMC